MPSYQNAPWPQQTPAALPDSSSSSSSKAHRPLKRRRSSLGISHQDWIRQVVAEDEVDEAETQCEFYSGNEIVTCYPRSDSTFPQHQWATVVWNSGLPDFTQTNSVNVYLFRADSRELLLSFYNRPNPRNQAGSMTAQVNDDWFGSDGASWNGSDLDYTFYWVVTRNDTELNGSELTQAHFTAIQTTYADSVYSSILSSSSAAEATITSSPSPYSTATPSSGPGSGGNGDGDDGSGNVQSGNSDSGFPHWAIAVIVVLGFLAIATTCILAFFIIRRMRRRNAELESNRNSMGSSSPMMAHVGNSPGSPLLATSAAGAAAERHSSVGHGQRAPSIVSPDGASTISRTGSAGDTGPFSGADAAIMADAFRKALRNAGTPVEEGDSPEEPQGELINRELADEGRDIRSVSSSRGVKVETLSDSGDTIHDDHHR